MAAKQNLSDRVDGDLVGAIARARQLDEKLAHFRSAGPGARRLTHEDLDERCGDALSEPDITLPMAPDFVRAYD